jgi:hypothetical protein
MHSKILLIYTGGTIGMMQSHSTGALKPFDFKHLKNEVLNPSYSVCLLHWIPFRLNILLIAVICIQMFGLS